MNVIHSPLHRVSALFGVGMLFLIGCGGGEAANNVKGKVTVKGVPVSNGTITFHGSKDASGPILNGQYNIDNPPTGQVKVSLKGMGGPPMPEKKELPGTLKSDKLLDPGGAGAGGAAIPKKYESPDNGLTYEVKSGKHTKDFELEP
jgi:hypothetical protein